MLSENAVNIASSALSGLISKGVCHPIDTCKAKLQSGTTFVGLSDLIKKTLQTEGILGFYEGLGAVLVGGVPGVVLYITSYETSKKYLSSFSFIEANPFASYFVSGMIAEAVCCSIFLPVDVVKERLQVQSNRPEARYKGSMDAFRTIIREESIRGLYKGYSATLFSYGPFSAMYFVLYEEAKKSVAARNPTKMKELSFSQNLLCSAVAGSLASFATNPLDVAKLRFQIQRNKIAASSSTAAETVGGKEEIFTGLWDALSKIYRHHGLKGLFRGALTRIAFHTPATAITMASYDQFKIMFSKW